MSIIISKDLRQGDTCSMMCTSQARKTSLRAAARCAENRGGLDHHSGCICQAQISVLCTKLLRVAVALTMVANAGCDHTP